MTAFVVGFDIGTSSSYVVIGQNNAIESVANEYSDRNTPSCVSFNNKTRLIGNEAKQQHITNIPNTVINFTQFIGKAFNNPQVQKEMTQVPFRVISVPNNRVGFELSYLSEKRVITPEQIYAMHITKLKEVAESNLSQEVTDVVVNIPTSATENEMQAILEAFKIANLNCSAIVKDNTATALAYGIYLDQLEEEKTVVFIDMGYANLQSSIVKFDNGSVRILATSCDTVGGRDFDSLIYKKFKKDLATAYKLKVADSSKPGVRLRQECEKLKKMMSANTMSIPLSIDCFMNDIDINLKMSRVELEDLARNLLTKVTSTLKLLLHKAKLTSKDIDSVEIVGGCSRIPAIKQIIGEIFAKEARTSLNADESVARGCALMGAVLAHPDKVHRYRVEDVSAANGKVTRDLLQYSPEKLAEFRQLEDEMRIQTRAETEKLFAKNSLEEFIYEAREKAETEVTHKDEEKERLLSEFTKLENWLYDEGENSSKREYEEKLEMMKNLSSNFFQ